MGQNAPMTIEAAIRWLYGLQSMGVTLGLERVQVLLERLGYPERSFPSILVGGTNGKGSVCAMLDAMLLASGRRCGLFTSPHLVRPNERIRIGGIDLDDRTLADLLTRIRGTAQAMDDHPSFFEVMTAAALLAFQEAAVSAAVLEVGLGGRLDATNAVDAVVSAIVTIDLDHVEKLGTTVERIAAEKAGIVKPGRPLVSGIVQPEAVAVVRAVCAERGATFLDARARPRPDGVPLALAGPHQVDNLRVALLVWECFTGTPAPSHVLAALSRVRWPGRLQRIDDHPPLLLDGAHNPAGAAALAAALDGMDAPRPVLLFATMRDKDVEGLLAPLRGRARSVVVTRSTVQRAAEPEAIRELVARILDVPVEVDTDVESALARARRLAGPDGLVLVAGSLYLVGDVLRALEHSTAPGPVSM